MQHTGGEYFGISTRGVRLKCDLTVLCRGARYIVRAKYEDVEKGQLIMMYEEDGTACRIANTAAKLESKNANSDSHKEMAQQQRSLEENANSRTNICHSRTGTRTQ